jgi:hypothetical protein
MGADAGPGCNLGIGIAGILLAGSPASCARTHTHPQNNRYKVTGKRAWFKTG